MDIMPIILFCWSLFKTWANVLIVSFTNWSTVWIIVPIWLSWFFAEFFQEKEGTSFGNAISNGVVPLWVGIDWLRHLTTQLAVQHAVKFSFVLFIKYAISVLVICYGLGIIIFGIRGKAFVRYLGRIREVTYLLATLTPFIYGLVALDYKYVLACTVFFPLFYLVIELIDRMTPEPEIYKQDQQPQQKASSSFGSFGGPSSSMLSSSKLPDDLMRKMPKF